MSLDTGVKEGGKKQIKVNIEAKDLSEDMNQMSTGNDEIIILIYDFSDSINLNSPLVSKQLLLDKSNSNKTFRHNLDSAAYSVSKLLVFLIESDTDRSLETLEPVIRIHYKAIEKAYKNHDFNSIEKYLGDEDVLGVKTINNPDWNKGLQVHFKGIHKLDFYDYRILVKK